MAAMIAFLILVPSTYSMYVWWFSHTLWMKGARNRPMQKLWGGVKGQTAVQPTVKLHSIISVSLHKQVYETQSCLHGSKLTTTAGTQSPRPH